MGRIDSSTNAGSGRSLYPFYTKARILLSASYAPVLGIMVNVDDEGVSITDPHSLRRNEPTDAILTRKPDLITEYAALREFFRGRSVRALKKDPEVASIQSRVGRNLSTILGVVGGAIVTHPSPDDGLLLPHLAQKSEGWEVVWFDESGNRVEGMDFTGATLDTEKGYQYAVVNKNFTSQSGK